MKLIVVGMDNTGKTTLCKELASKLNALHATSLGPNHTREEMLEEIRYYMDKSENVVFERFSIFEELIYGKILRGKSKFAFEDIDLIKKYKPIIIYCRPDNDIIFNFGSREQMDGVIEYKEELVKAWDDLIFNSISGFKIIKYDWTKDKLGNLLPGGIRNEYYTREE